MPLSVKFKKYSSAERVLICNQICFPTCGLLLSVWLSRVYKKSVSIILSFSLICTIYCFLSYAIGINFCLVSGDVLTGVSWEQMAFFRGLDTLPIEEMLIFSNGKCSFLALAAIRLNPITLVNQGIEF